MALLRQVRKTLWIRSDKILRFIEFFKEYAFTSTY